MWIPPAAGFRYSICPAVAPRSQSTPLLPPGRTSPRGHNPTPVAGRDHLMYAHRAVRFSLGPSNQPPTVISPLETQHTHIHTFHYKRPPGPAPGTHSRCWYHGHMGLCDTEDTPVSPAAAPWTHWPCDLWSASSCCTHTPMHRHTRRIESLTQEKR